MDFFSSLGELGLGSRLKRLSDICMSEVKQVYASAGLDFEPRWFPLFFFLHKRGEITVTEAAAELGTTHPHISLLAKEMVQAKLVSFKANPSDKRSRILAMTVRGRSLVNDLEPVWDSIRKTVSSLIDEADPLFLTSLEKVERAFQAQPLSLAVQKQIKIQVKSKCKILDYAPDLKKYFESLNREWLEKYFAVENVDLEYFADPKKKILAKGGDIFFAELNGDVVGTCSLLREGKNMELAKMAVTQSAQGNGIGELLVREAIRRAKKMKAEKIMLITNSRLAPAIGLYEKLGFKEIFRGQHPKYKRGDVVMEKAIS